MLKLEKTYLGNYLASRAIRTLCWLLPALVLGPTLACGNDIKAPDTVGNVGRFTSISLNAKGYPVVSYHDLTNRDLKLLHCDDPNCDGEQSGSISTPDASGMVGAYTSLALDSAGNPVASYYDVLNGKLKLLHCDNSDCSSSNISIPDASDLVGKYASLTLDAAGNPVVSYYDNSNGDLKLLHCDDPDCTGDESGNISKPDVTGDVGLYTSLALDAVGNPVVSYHASDSGLKILHCDDPKCEGDESKNITNPDPDEVGWFSSLSLDAAGNPVVGYYNFQTGDLKILHCDDPNCAGDESKNITTPDATGYVGTYISMALDAKGNPVVSYYDATKGKLKILHCDDPKCVGDETGNITTPVDTTNNVGLYSSLALDAKGNPVVSYYDFTNGDLNIMHCTDRNCRTEKRQP